MKKLNVFCFSQQDQNLARAKMPDMGVAYEFHLIFGDTSPESLIFISTSTWNELEAEERSEGLLQIEASFKVLCGNQDELSAMKIEFDLASSKLLMIDFDLPKMFTDSTLRSFVSLIRNSEARELLKIGESLNQLVTQSLRELQRVKKIHETLVPLRTEKIKGLTITSKFAAGESSGGEFYDVIEGDQEFVIMVSHTTSYVASSLILSEFDFFRQKKSFQLSDLEDFTVKVGKKVKGVVSDKDFQATHIFLARVDMKSLLIEGLNFGKFQLVSDDKFYVGENEYFIDESFLPKVSFSSKLNRSCLYALVSPGLRKCCGGKMMNKDLLTFARELLPEGSHKFLQEIFYQLKKGRESSFLEFDATSIFIEVDQNVIVQI